MVAVGTVAVGTVAVDTEAVGTEAVALPAEATAVDSAADVAESPGGGGLADYAGLILTGLGLLIGAAIVGRRWAGRQ